MRTRCWPYIMKGERKSRNFDIKAMKRCGSGEAGRKVKNLGAAPRFFSSPYILYIFLPIFAAIYCGVPRGHLYINVCICANAISIVFSVLLSRATHPFLDVVLFYVVNFVLGAVESFDKFCRGIGSFREQSRIRIVLFFIFVNRKNRLSANFHAYTH
ncbi:hypothetical protein PthstB1num2_26580 [Parageobacillus thermoglucosidasius]|nr:hypothetical protein PthstB1num2_26580 [Parageobacillus thermoglucosidasius]